MTKPNTLRELQREAYLAVRSDLNPPTDHPEGIHVLDNVFNQLEQLILQRGKEAIADAKNEQDAMTIECTGGGG